MLCLNRLISPHASPSIALHRLHHLPSPFISLNHPPSPSIALHRPLSPSIALHRPLFSIALVFLSPSLRGSSASLFSAFSVLSPTKSGMHKMLVKIAMECENGNHFHAYLTKKLFLHHHISGFFFFFSLKFVSIFGK